MKHQSQIIKDGLFVTIGGLVAMAIAFLVYLLLFTLFETFMNQDGLYTFVSYLRIVYGMIAIMVCVLIYQTKWKGQIKASILAGSLTTCMASIGVQLYDKPLFIIILLSVLTIIALILLYFHKKPWYHYYALVMTLVAALLYI